MNGHQRRGRVKSSELVDGLTPKQYGFVRDYLRTGDGVMAAKLNYTIKNANVAGAIASENFKKPAVRLSIGEELTLRMLQAQAEKQATLRKLKQEADLAFQRDDIATGLNITTKIGKILGMFKTRRR